jgi:putative spermidine/putrescine transport system permease protein
MPAPNPLLTVTVSLVLLFLGFPLILIAVLSFSAAPNFVFPPRALSLEWYLNVFHNEQFSTGLQQSLMIAGFATTVAILVSLPASYAIARHRFVGRQLLNTLVMAPLIVPEVVIGIAALTWLAAIRLDVPPYSLFFLHALLLLPYAMRVIVASLEGGTARLEEAAITLGASPLRAFVLVTMPRISRAIGAACLFCFVHSFHNLTATIFLIKSKPTLSLAIFGYITTRNDPTIAALSTLLIALTTILVLTGERFFGLVREMRAR